MLVSVDASLAEWPRLKNCVRSDRTVDKSYTTLLGTIDGSCPSAHDNLGVLGLFGSMGLLCYTCPTPSVVNIGYYKKALHITAI